MKELVMVFDTNGTSKMTISIDNPKEEIALSDVQAAAEKLIPILITSSGAEITALNKASIVTSHGVLYHFTLLIPIITGQLREVLKA